MKTNPYKPYKKNERHNSQRKSPPMSSDTGYNPVKMINENPNYRLVNTSMQKERNLLRKCILQLTQTGTPYKAYIKDGIHGPMLRRVHKYNQDENRSLRLIRKDILEITKIEHARVCIDQQPKIEVSPTLYKIVFDQDKEQTTQTVVEGIEHKPVTNMARMSNHNSNEIADQQPVTNVARMPSPSLNESDDMFPNSPNLLNTEWFSQEHQIAMTTFNETVDQVNDNDADKKPAAKTKESKTELTHANNTSPTSSIQSTDEIDQRIMELDKKIEHTQHEIEIQTNLTDNICNIVDEIATDRLQKTITEEITKVIEEGGIPDRLTTTMQHATMINEQLIQQIEKAQKCLTELSENIRIKKSQYEKLINQEKVLATKMEKTINKTYHDNQMYMTQLQETLKTKAMAKQEKSLNERISVIADNIHNTKKRQFLSMVNEQKQRMEHTINETINTKTQTFEQRMEQWTNRLQTDIDSAGGHLEQEMAYIQRETQEKWHDEWPTEKHGTMQEELREILPSIISEHITNNPQYLNNRIDQMEKSIQQVNDKIEQQQWAQQNGNQIHQIATQQREHATMLKQHEEHINMIRDTIPNTTQHQGSLHNNNKAQYPIHNEHDDQPNTPRPANIINHTFTVQQNLPKFRKEIIPCHLPAEPRQDQLEQFYDTIANMMHIYELPILHRKDLTKQGSTCPRETYLTPEMTENVNRMLYHKLIEMIPEDVTAIRDILASYSHEQDGYRSLYAIMRTRCKYLRIIQPKWGPTWHAPQTGYQYLATFKSFVDEEKRYYRHYSKYDQAAEILQQAAMHESHKLMATSYLTRLIHTEHKNDKEFPNEFMPNNLINILETSKNEQPPTEIDQIPTIHKFGRKPFQHKVQKQCTACKVWGHDIDEQVCRICAQISFCMEYIHTNPEKAHKNATAFALAHNKTRVAKVRQALGDIYPINQEDDEETIMSFARAVTIPDDEQSSITDELGERE